MPEWGSLLEYASGMRLDSSPALQRIEETLEDVLWQTRAGLPQMVIWIGVAVVLIWLTQRWLEGHWIAATVLWVGVGLIVLIAWILVSLLLAFAKHSIALYLCCYLLFDQHDRAICGVRWALEHRLPIVLYLRGFGDEQESAAHHFVEQQLVNAVRINDAFMHPVVVVALGSPLVDLSDSLFPIPRLFVGSRWDDFVSALVSRASVCVILKGGSGSGLDWEIGEIVKQNRDNRTLLVRVDSKESRNAEDGLERKISQSDIRQFDFPETGEIEALEQLFRNIFAGFVMKHDDRKSLARIDLSKANIEKTSDRRRYRPARLFLYGLFYGPKISRLVDYSRYATGLFSPAEFDPLETIRDLEMSKPRLPSPLHLSRPPDEKTAKARGWPVWSKTDIAEIERWNWRQLSAARQDRAADILTNPRAWLKLRRMMHQRRMRGYVQR